MAKFDGSTMPFGQHKGKRLADLSDDYLDWLMRCCDDREIVMAAEDELADRES